jgi:hypothetical protein
VRVTAVRRREGFEVVMAWRGEPGGASVGRLVVTAERRDGVGTCGLATMGGLTAFLGM